MSRWQAAGIHGSISAVVTLIIGALLLGLWYPPPYFHAAGADALVPLLCGSLVIGPLLTLIVFRRGKRGMKFDLVIIALVHAAAVAFSLWIIAGSRPVFLVAAVDRIVAVSANAIADTDLQQGSAEEFRTRSWTGPRLTAIELPTEPAERNQLVFLAGDRNVEDLPRYYVAYGEGSKPLLSTARALDTLRGKSAAAAALVDGWLRRSGRNASDIRWVPLQARKDDLVMLLDQQSAQPLQALAIDPW